jgi:hypothetical protein
MDHLGREAKEAKFKELRALRMETSIRCYNLISRKLDSLDCEELSVSDVMKIFQILMQDNSSFYKEQIPLLGSVGGIQNPVDVLLEVKSAQNILADPISRDLICSRLERSK